MYSSRAFAARCTPTAVLAFADAFSVAVFATVLTAGSAFAQAVDYVEIRSGKYKMTDYGETGDEVPRTGPVIEVYSRSGVDYDTISNDNEGLNFIVGLKGRCDGNQRVGKAELTLPGGSERLKINKRRQAYSRGFKTVTTRSAFTLPDIGRTPAQACMKELDRRVSRSSLSREEWIERGFVVKYDDAYRLGFALTCNQGKGWNQFGSAETSAPVWIACQPSKVAAAGAGQEAAATASSAPDSGPAESPTRLTERSAPASDASPVRAAERVIRTTSDELVSALTLNVNKEDYQGRCPVALRFSGNISASRAGIVQYRLVDDQGNQSPLRSLKFAAAGSQNIIGWSKAFSKPREAQEGAEDGDSKANYEGWVRIKIVEPHEAMPSDAAVYQVTCK